jgi:hypothetical protein
MKGDEKGQALPLAILVLAIGSLVVAPFLGQASASLTGSRLYGRGLAELYAGDAGIEHAIWSLAYGGLAESFDGPGDQVTYQFPETVNGLTATVTITANVTASPAGEIEDAIIDSEIFDYGTVSDPDIVHVSGDVYAVAYRGSGFYDSPGYLKTVTITASGQISSVIDSLEFENDQAENPGIIQVSGNIFAIAYQGSGYSSNPGYLKTVSIAANGQISNYVIDTLVFDSSQGASPDIVHVSGDVYAVAYQGDGYHSSPGYLKTVNIAVNGQIGNYVIDSLTFESSQGAAPDIVHVSGNIYAVAYQGDGYYSSPGYLKTVNIAVNGQIGNSVIDTLTFDGSQGASACIVPVSGDIYAIAYQGSGDDGFVRTLSIAANGYIGNSIIDSFEFDTSDGREPAAIYVAGDTYAVAYRGPASDGFLKTLSIAAAGDIAGAVTDTLEFDTGDGYWPDIVNISAGVFAIAYRGPSSRGYIKTVGITTGSTEAAYEIVASAGSRTVRAFVNTSGEAASIVSWRIE